MSAKRRIQQSDDHIKFLTETIRDLAIIFPSIKTPPDVDGLVWAPVWDGFGHLFPRPNIRYDDIAKAAESIRQAESDKLAEASGVQAKRLVDDLRGGKVNAARDVASASSEVGTAKTDVIQSSTRPVADKLRQIIREEIHSATQKADERTRSTLFAGFDPVDSGSPAATIDAAAFEHKAAASS